MNALENYFNSSLILLKVAVQFSKKWLSQFENQLNQFLKTSSVGLSKPAQPVFELFYFFCTASLLCEPKSCAQLFLKTGSAGFDPDPPPS
jgi:hypothetical protein